MARFMITLPTGFWKMFAAPLAQSLNLPIHLRDIAEKVGRAALILQASTPQSMYSIVMSYWTNPAQVVLGASEPPMLLSSTTDWPKLDEFIHQMMYVDTLTYLSDDILTKVDRATMGVSLETRIPLLDHRIVEFAWQLPLSLKARNGKSKWLIRQVLSKYLPGTMFERPKMGFGLPIDQWLRGPMRDWAESLLDEKVLRDQGFFDPNPIRQKWQEHLSGVNNWQYQLWSILIFQAWLEEQEARAA
jgi:asparagine synthase (glutamine-hydrolysing)